MKIRLMGSPDIVRAWADQFQREFGIVGQEYGSRRGGNEVRYYLDIDDRLAARVGQVDASEPDDNALTEGKK